MNTRTIRRATSLATGLLVLLPLHALAADPPNTWAERGMFRPLTAADPAKKLDRELPRPTDADRVLIGTTAPIYIPPRRGTTVSTLRVSGGTRGNAGGQPIISVLAPNGDGTTIHDQPTLYWYTSRPLVAPVLFTLIEVDAVAPTAVIRLVAPAEAGIHSIRLAELGTRLAPGTTYHWSVAVVTDATRRSHDLVATGAIEYIPGAAVAIDPAHDYHAYAQQGLWYDAMTALSNRLSTDPTDEILHGHRATLLEAVGLGHVAGYDWHHRL